MKSNSRMGIPNLIQAQTERRLALAWGHMVRPERAVCKPGLPVGWIMVGVVWSFVLVAAVLGGQ